MTQALLVVGGLFLLIYVPLALLAWRRPLLARFAWREATRRRGQFALLVVGLMVGSASITASLVASDSGVQTFGSLSDARLSAVDLTVTSTRGSSFPLQVAMQIGSDSTLTPYVDGVQAGIEIPASVADLDRQLGRPAVLAVGFDPSSQKRFGAYVLADGRRTYGEDLGAGDVLLSSGLASTLEARSGDQLRIASGSHAETFHVYGTARPIGPGAYGSYLAVYMPLTSTQLLTGDPGINVVRVAAKGSNAADASSADRVKRKLLGELARMDPATPLMVNEVRRDAAASLADITAALVGPLLGFSSLTVLAAIALIVNLVKALADERRTQLAVLRALGLSRAGLIGLSIIEGAIYSVAAAIAGVAAGVPAGLYLANQLWSAATIDPLDQQWLGYPLQVAVRPGTLALAFAAGALVTLGTVAGAAFRTSRMAIAPAIRDLPEPGTRPGRPWLRTASLLLVAALSAGLLIPDDLRTRLIGGVALIATAGALARARVPDRLRATLTGVFAAGWAALVATAVGNPGVDLYQVVTVIFLAAAVSAAGLSIAAAANLRLIDLAIGLAGKRGGRLQAALRPPLAYLSRRPMRTGLAITAFAMVLVLVTGIAVITAGPRPSYARNSAGYDIAVVTSGANPIQLPPQLQQDVAGEMALQMRTYAGSVAGRYSSTSFNFYILPDEPVDAGPVYLDHYSTGFGRGADVWRALRTDPHLAVSAQAGLGDYVTLEGPAGAVELRVVGKEGPSVLQGLIVSRAALADLDTSPGGTTLLIKARPGVDPKTLTHRIERALFDQGIQATSIRDILDQDYTSGLDYITEYDVLLHMGLLVGVLALSMIGIRAAIERRRMIGVLRALGYQPAQVLMGLVTETAVMTTIGAVTGIAAGIMLAYALVGASGATTVADAMSAPGNFVTRLGVALAIVYATVLAVTVPLAARAARMAPAEAIRLTG